MDDIRAKIENKDYHGLISTCEALEFEIAVIPIPDLTISAVYSALLGAYLVVNDLNSARFLRKRLLQHFKSESNVPEEINAIWSVGAALWNRSLPEAYNALDSYTWSDDMRQLMDAVRETIQEMAYTLICRSYSSIKVNSAAQMLGMPQDVLAAALAKRGWLLDEETQLLRPTTIPTDSHEKISLDQLSKLEDIVVYLESS